MFFNGSRYQKMSTYDTMDAQGRAVKAVVLPLPTQPRVAAEYVLRERQRLDLLAAQFLENATAFWRLCDVNNVMHPDELRVTGKRILIPVREP
jgi:hypothetical protein